MQTFKQYYEQTVLDERSSKIASTALAAALLGGMPSNAPLANEPSHSANISQKVEKSKYSEQEKHNIFARTLWAEARNDGEEGMRAVANIIWNRGKGDPNRMVTAIKTPKQFSCWNRMTKSDWDNFKMKEKSGPEWVIAEKLASELIDGTFMSRFNYDHYFNPDKARPSWGFTDSSKRELKPHKRVGKHVFMRLGSWVMEG